MVVVEIQVTSRPNTYAALKGTDDVQQMGNI